MTGRTGLVLAVLALGGLAGCGGDHGPDAQPSPAPSGTAVPSARASALPTPPPAALAAEEIGRLDPRRLPIRFGDWLAAGAGSVWVKTDDGTVVRVDPEEASVRATIRVTPDTSADALCQGLGASDEAVWACAPGGKVVRIDPATDRVAATVEAGKFNDQGQIPVAFGAAWVLVEDGSRLAAIRDDAVAAVYDLGTRCTELSATSEALWAACPIDGLAVRIDPSSGQVTARITGLPDARSVGGSPGGDVWVGFAGGLARIAREPAEVALVADAHPGLEGGVYGFKAGAWARARGDFLRFVDPVTGEVRRRITAPEQSGGEVLVAYGYLWATAHDDDVLYRLSVPPGSYPS